MGYTRDSAGDLKPSCDGWCESATQHTPATITHIDDKGYGYCSPCAETRRGTHRVRALTEYELTLLAAGTPIPSFDNPTTKAP